MQFHKFVNSYTKLWEYCKANEQSKYYNILQLEIRVYLIPMGFNTLSQYVATYDDMYNQEIFLPFVKDPLLPKLHPDAVKKEVPLMEAEKLGAYWATTAIQAARERQVQMYLREATRFMPIKVCKAELIKYSTKPPFSQKPESSTTVFFVYRTEIGFHSVYSKSSASCTQINLPEMSSKGPDSVVPIKLKYMRPI